MNIRRATLLDLPQLSLLFDGYRVFYRKESDVKAASSFLKERFTQDDSVIFVADDDGKLVGFTQLYPIFSSTNLKRAWLLNDLYIDGAARGSGTSILLLEKAKELARETNAHGIILETEKSNAIGNQLYPRAGFERNTVANFYEWTCN